MLDLICRRYPGTRPSSFLDLDDDFVAIQVDYAIAKKHDLEDQKYEMNKLEAISDMLKPLGTALGVEYEAKKTNNATGEEELMDIDQALAIFGSGNGTVVKHG